MNYKTVSIYTDIIPVIIDYGRSQVDTFGYAAPPLEKLEYSHFQDILSLVLSSLSSILHVKYQSNKWYQIGRDREIYFKLLEICTDKKFNTIQKVKKYCKYEKNLSLLLLRDNTHTELEPIEFFHKLAIFESTITWKKQVIKRDTRRNSFAMYKLLCW